MYFDKMEKQNHQNYIKKH